MHVNEFLVMFVKVTIEYLGNCCLVVRSPFIINYESTLTKELLCELNDDDFAIFNLHLHPNSLCQRKGKSSFSKSRNGKLLHVAINYQRNIFHDFVLLWLLVPLFQCSIYLTEINETKGKLFKWF